MLLESFKINFPDGIYAYDFEYRQPSGENPTVVCMVIKNLLNGRTYRISGKDLKKFPVPITDDSLFIAHYAPAEINSMLSLGFKKPKFIFDTHVESKKLYWGKQDGFAFGLVDCCARYGIKGVMSKEHKDDMRDLIIENDTYSTKQMTDIIKYCEEDVLNLEQLFYKILEDYEKEGADPATVLTQSTFHGRAMGVCAQIETNGIPVNEELYNNFNKHFPIIKNDIIVEANKTLNVFDENNKFKKDKFTDLIIKLGLDGSWPRSDKTKKFKEDKDTLRKFKNVPEIQLLRETLDFSKANNLKGYEVGSDGRSRTNLSMFGQITGRTNVSTSRSPYSAPKFLRGFIQADKNKVLAEFDWAAQEAGIMAYLSKDQNMIKDFETGNLYLLCAIKNGAAPEGAIKATHPEIRNQYKVAVLGCGYGQTAFGLKYALKIPVYEAETIIQNIKKTYPDFFKWNQGVCCGATSRGYFKTKYGWRYWIPKIYKPNTLKNWLMQSHGAEILRRAMIAVDEAGIEISMIMHDALLVHVDRKGCAGKFKQVRQIMEQAAKDVLGAVIPVEIKIIKKDYKLAEEPQKKWNRIMSIYNKSRCNEKLHLKNGGCR